MPWTPGSHTRKSPLRMAEKVKVNSGDYPRLRNITTLNSGCPREGSSPSLDFIYPQFISSSTLPASLPSMRVAPRHKGKAPGHRVYSQQALGLCTPRVSHAEEMQPRQSSVAHLAPSPTRSRIPQQPGSSESSWVGSCPPDCPGQVTHEERLVWQNPKQQFQSPCPM